MQNRWVPFFVNRFIYLSLPFFDKSEEECETGFEKLIYVLKYMEYWKDCLLRYRRRYSIILHVPK